MQHRAGMITIGIALLAAGTGASTGCNQLIPLLPALAFCNAPAAPTDLLKLAEGPALFVDAMRTVLVEVAGQTKTVGDGLAKGLSLDQQALQALGPYHFEGAGTYKRQAAADRAFRLRFFYGDGVSGKTPGQPLEADMTRLDSYIPGGSFGDLLNPGAPRGPLFPLIEASGFGSGGLKLRDDALRFDVGSVVSANLKGYDLKLNLGTSRNTVSQLLKQLADRKLAFSLDETSLSHAGLGFSLAVKKFDLAVGLDGRADLGGDYLFEVANGPLKYFGAVKTLAGVPSLSLRCNEAATSEFGTVSFADGKADFKINQNNFPITLPGLAPLTAPL